MKFTTISVAFLSLSALSSACTDYYKILAADCAEACLGEKVGICPISVVTKFGGLKAGKCTNEGFTKPNGTISQPAGPCGKIVFNTFTKTSNDLDSASTKDEDDISLATFDGAKGTTFHWQAVDDPVMGGKSHSQLTAASVPGGTARWYGQVAIVPFLHAPGFCTITTDNATFADVSGTEFFKMYARNNATSELDRFMLQLETKGGRTVFKQGTYNGNVTIPATGEWVEVHSQWSDFILTWRGEHINGPKLTSQLDQIESVGLSTAFPGKPGTFDLEIKWMHAGN